MAKRNTSQNSEAILTSFRKSFQYLKRYLKTYHRWLIGILVTVLVVPLGVALQHRAPETKQLSYLPPNTSATKSVTNDRLKCWSSQMTARGDAYSCSPNGQDDNADRLDPCFVADDLQSVTCPNVPSDDRVSYSATTDLFRSIERVPLNKAQLAPWFITLDRGVKCRYSIGGASALLDGRIDYGCDNRQSLLLPIDKASALWTIRCVNASRRVVETCKIREAWY